MNLPPSSRNDLPAHRRTQRHRLTWAGLGLIAPLTVFAALGEEVATSTVIPFDRTILEWLHGHATTTLDAVMLFITNVGGAQALLALLAALLLSLLWLRRWRDAAFALLAFGGAEITNLLLKALFARARPHLWPALSVETSFGFPSGHATGSVALAAIVAILLWKTRWRVPALLIGVLFGGLVSVSRLYLGVHYPSDVIAGAAASLAWVTLLVLISRRELFAARA